LSLPLVLLVESEDSTSVVEGGASDTYTLVLNREPTGNVDVAIAPDSQTQVDIPLVTFTPSDWDVAQTITVTAVDDAVSEGAHLSYIVHTTSSTDADYHGLPVTFANSLGIPRLTDSADLVVTVLDNDSPPGGLADQVALASCQCRIPQATALPAAIPADAVFGRVGETVEGLDNVKGQSAELELLRLDEDVANPAQFVEQEQSCSVDDLAWAETAYSARRADAENDTKNNEKAVDLILQVQNT